MEGQLWENYGKDLVKVLERHDIVDQIYVKDFTFACLCITVHHHYHDNWSKGLKCVQYVILCYYLSNIYIVIANFVEFATNNIKYSEEGSGRVGPKSQHAVSWISQQDQVSVKYSVSINKDT